MDIGGVGVQKPHIPKMKITPINPSISQSTLPTHLRVQLDAPRRLQHARLGGLQLLFFFVLGFVFFWWGCASIDGSISR
jgi:hypothetical protein